MCWGGREDVWEPIDVYRGSEATWLGDQCYSDRELDHALRALQVGLLYVKLEGSNGTPDPLMAAKDIRETFRRMALNDEEKVELIASGSTFCTNHGAGKAKHVGSEPAGVRSRIRDLAGRAAVAAAPAATPSPVASK